jgi:hypothetical protein
MFSLQRTAALQNAIVRSGCNNALVTHHVAMFQPAAISASCAARSLTTFARHARNPRAALLAPNAGSRGLHSLLGQATRVPSSKVYLRPEIRRVDSLGGRHCESIGALGMLGAGRMGTKRLLATSANGGQNQNTKDQARHIFRVMLKYIWPSRPAGTPRPGLFRYRQCFRNQLETNL